MPESTNDEDDNKINDDTDDKYEEPNPNVEVRDDRVEETAEECADENDK
jgi:hypothetical protein